ncbi:MAG: ATP synthase F0 subunit B [Candidatus Hydrogenedentota bacterium]
MVTINLTLFVELGLFLVFLWGTQHFILAPVVKSLDEREESIESDRVHADDSNENSVALEKEYRHEIALIRRKSDEEIRAAHQKSQQEHAAFLIAERARSEEAVAEVREEALRMVDDQQSAMTAEIPALVKQIEAKLTSGSD